jgi:hypothetical protein
MAAQSRYFINEILLSPTKFKFQRNKLITRDLQAQFTGRIFLSYPVIDPHNSRVKEFVDVTSFVFQVARFFTVVDWLDININKKPITVNIYRVSQ